MEGTEAQYLHELCTSLYTLQELMMENASLRESLASVQKELISLLNRRQARRQEEPDVSAVSTCLYMCVCSCVVTSHQDWTSNSWVEIMTPLLVKSGTTSDFVYNFKWKALLVHILVASWHSTHFSTELPLRAKFIHTVSIYLISIFTKCVHEPSLDGASTLCTANVMQ